MGNINLKWAIIAGLFIVILIAFGRNPVDEAQERYQLSKQGKDPLMQAIDEHNFGTKKGGFGARSAPGGPINLNRNSYNQVPSYMRRETYQNPYSKPPATPPVPVAPADSYYPPPPMPDGSTSAPVNPFAPQSSIHQRLTSGKPVSFAGTEVFTIDERGQSIPMPDGDYKMYDGRVTVIVRAGRQIVISN